MTRDFEEELRRSLRDRAGDVTPDPAMFARVQSRIRRERAVRFAVAGVAGAFAITGVAVAAPSLMDRRVEFRPPAVGEAPASEATATEGLTPPVVQNTPAARPGLPPIIWTDGRAVSRISVAGESGSEVARFESPACPAAGECPGVLRITARPEPDAAVVSVEGCNGLRYPGGEALFAADTCPVSATFSPDGRHLAWVGQAGPDGEWMLHTAAWTSDGPDEATTSFAIPVKDPTAVDLQDWVWTNETPTTADGYLIVRTRRDDIVRLVGMSIERQPDGALATGGDQGVVADTGGRVALALASGGDEVTYTLEAVQAPAGLVEARIVRRTGSDVDGELPVSPDLLSTTPDFDEFDLWMSAVGDTLVYGNSATKMAWWVDWSQPPVNRDLAEAAGAVTPIVHADLIPPAYEPPAVQPPDHADTSNEVDVFFGMKGAEACVADQRVQRLVDGPGVARGALHALFAGPKSRESNEGIESPFSANTADVLNDIEIVNGQARVDLRDFSGDVGTDSCTKSAILDSLDKTLLQFPTVTSTRYSFDGSVEAWEAWLGSDTEHPEMPGAVTATADAILAAAQERDYDALRGLSEETSCTLSDQPEPCVPAWKEQERNGEDPLGVLAEIMQTAPARAPDTKIWVWPGEAFGGRYSGPRVGVDADGRWLYYVQEGG